jgi:hypothetical protein
MASLSQGLLKTKRDVVRIASNERKAPLVETETFGIWVTGTALIILALIQFLWPPDPNHPTGPRFLSFLVRLAPWLRLFVTAVLPVFTGILGYLLATKRQRKTSAPSPPPSKLIIHSADYRAIYGGGDIYEVSRCLQQMIIGHCLEFDIENHNFVAGGHNCVPKDPKSGERKRLRVFRDFLLAQYLFQHIFRTDKARFTALLEASKPTEAPTTEGLKRFLFYLSRKIGNEDFRDFYAGSPWYSDVFEDEIFNISSDRVLESDESEIANRLLRRDHRSQEIAVQLATRWHPDVYPHLNLDLLLKIAGRRQLIHSSELHSKPKRALVAHDRPSTRSKRN